MTNVYHALHTYLLSALQSSATSATPTAAAPDPASLVTALTDLLAFTTTHALPALAAFAGTLGSVLADPDRLMLWLDYQYVRDHLAAIAAVAMALIVAWMAWQAMWAVQRIMRVVVGMAVKLLVAGVVLAVVWNVYNSATMGAGSGYPQSAPAASKGGDAYGRGGAAGGGLMDQVFSAAKGRWMQQQGARQQEQQAAGGEYSYAWAGGKYRNRREAEMDNGL